MDHQIYFVFLCVLGILCGSGSLAFAADENEPGGMEPPISNRPMNFSGAIGTYAISMKAEPTELQAEDRILLTVRITVTGAGSLKQIQRPDLRKLPQFAKQFDIENGTERDLPGEKSREFDYRLRPRNALLKQIPSLPFVYFNPAVMPPTKGYQWAYARAIPLTVKPRAAVTSAQVQSTHAAPDYPDGVYQIVSGSVVLRREQSFALPGWGILAIILALPPVACMAWLVVWRRAHPDDGQVARQRRSRAARQALRAIGALERLPPEEQALRVKEILVSYLRERFDFGIYEPTPLEVSAHLQQMGLSAGCAQEASRFFAACDAARFAPGFLPEYETWAVNASGLVQTLEEEPCPAQAP